MLVRRTAAAAAAAAALGSGTLVPIVLGATLAGAVSEPEVVADGLDNPYKLSFGPDGAVYVAEAGTGGVDCIESQDPETGQTIQLCAGSSGAVTRVDLSGATPTQERVVTGLSSAAGPDGNGAGGPQAVAVDADGTIYVALALGGAPDLRDALGASATQLGTVVAVPDGGSASILTDLAGFEANSDPNPDAGQPSGGEVDSNPFDIELVDGRLLAADAGGNDILDIDPDTGATTVAAVLPFKEADAPPFLGAPPGTKLPVQPVPTAVSDGPLGTLVGELTGFPFPVGAADVYALDVATGTLTVEESGFTNVIDIAQAPDGTLYVLEFSSEGLLNVPEGAPPTSRLIQVRTDGTRKVLLQDELVVPAGVAVGPDGLVYVVNGSQFAGGGSVIRVDPSVARDAATASACIPDDVPGAGFTDVDGDVHRESIDCLAFWGLVLGIDADTFAPSQSVSRGQVATIVVRLLDELTADPLPAGDDAFTDDEGNAHEASINTLAALGLVAGTGPGTFSPNAPVTRGQLTTILAATYEHVAGSALADGPDAFTDDETNVHEANINALAAAGWVTGKTATTFAPNDPTTRGQLASVAARMLSTLVDGGVATPPTPA